MGKGKKEIGRMRVLTLTPLRRNTEENSLTRLIILFAKKTAPVPIRNH